MRKGANCLLRNNESHEEIEFDFEGPFRLVEIGLNGNWTRERNVQQQEFVTINLFKAFRRDFVFSIYL